MEEYTVKVYKNRIEWYQNNKLHRLDGPAIEWDDGSKFWYQNDKVHRLNGPACECADGTKYWYQNDKRHRLDGPACEYANGTKHWWVEGKQYTEEEFNKKINPVVELTVDEISKRLGFTVKVVGNA